MKFQINFVHVGNGHKRRADALILDAKDKKAAIEAASKQLANDYDWHKITSVVDLGQINLPEV